MAGREQAALADTDGDWPLTQFTVALDQQGQRLDQVLSALPQALSRGHVQGLIDEGAVCLDGQPCRQSAKRLRLGQQIEVEWRLPESAMAFTAEALPLDIVHEDDDLMVLNKRAGWVVHPAAGNWTGTVLNGLLAHHAGAAALPRAGIVHRLDKDTSGLMVVAKTLPAYHALVEALAARTVRREYLALCHGAWSEPCTVDAPVARDPRSRIRMGVVAGGKAARTDFTPLALAKRHTLLHCQLHTGRTHQIRVHAASRRHPLVADVLYGGTPELGLTRQALHAARLSLTHPRTGDAWAWTQALPEDMASACRALWEAAPIALPD
jgi:23S rRNA pseudouridine1911/1915/1917 synthase